MNRYNRETGGKWSIHEVKRYMTAKHGEETANRAFSDVQDVMIHALESVQDVIQNDKQCFELYGYDIMFDANLKPWLLEVNQSPSLTANTREDYNLKCRLLNEMLDIIDIENAHVSNSKLHVGGFDQVYDGTRIDPYPGSVYGTLLGAEVPDPSVLSVTSGGSKKRGGTSVGAGTSKTSSGGGGGGRRSSSVSGGARRGSTMTK